MGEVKSSGFIPVNLKMTTASSSSNSVRIVSLCNYTNPIPAAHLDRLFSSRFRRMVVDIQNVSKLLNHSGVSLMNLKSSLSAELSECVMKYHDKIEEAGGVITLNYTSDRTTIVVKLPATSYGGRTYSPSPPCPTLNSQLNMSNSKAKSIFTFVLTPSEKLECKSAEMVATLMTQIPEEIVKSINNTIPRITQIGGKVKFAFENCSSRILIKLPSIIMVTSSSISVKREQRS